MIAYVKFIWKSDVVVAFSLKDVIAIEELSFQSCIASGIAAFSPV